MAGKWKIGRRRAGPSGLAFTLLELLVVVSIITLLLAILLPGLAAAREEAKRAVCLANLRNIGTLMTQYALSDPAEQPIPIHQSMLAPCPYWEWRTVNWFAWGGHSGQKPFLTGPGEGILLSDADDPEARPQYAARNRPLNLYAFGSVGDAEADALDWYRCPSDRGYPQHEDIDDSPYANAERSCYETLGNSYRASLSMATLTDGDHGSLGHFSSGPWGHRLSSLRSAARVVLVGEPTFFNMIGRDDVHMPSPDPVLVTGWHRRRMTDNLAFCDGSARTAQASRRHEFTPEALERMAIYDASMLSRGRTWQLDCYPVEGARLWGEPELWRATYGDAYDNAWPFARRQENMRGH